MIVQTVGIEVPDDFPAQMYNAFHARIAPLQPKHAEAFRHYGGAWNAIAIRFRMAAEADESFRDAERKTETVLNRYLEEKALFEFFSSAYATLDSLAYGLYGVGAMVDQSTFQLNAEALRTVTPAKTASMLVQRFPTEEIGPALLASINDPAALELKELRNALSHRTSSTRTIELSTRHGIDPGTKWCIEHLQLRARLQELVIDGNTTARYRHSLAVQLKKLLATSLSFANMAAPNPV